MPINYPKIFINYRRKDSAGTAQLIALTIQEAFGPKCIFIDRDGIHVGDDWAMQIQHALQCTEVLVVVIGAHWLKSADEHGRRRIDLESDWVRKEILHAIENKLTIIPLLVSEAKMPVRQALPDCLGPLWDTHFLTIRDDHFKSDLEPVLEKLDQAGFRRVTVVNPLTDSANIVAEQFAALKRAVELNYRARIISRKCFESIEENSIDERLTQLKSIRDDFENLLFAERVLLPNDIFEKLHTIKHEIYRFVDRFERRENRNVGDANDLATSFERFNSHYDELVRLVQDRIGVGG